MWALYVFGPQVEREVGPGPFLSLYLASAAVGSAFAFFLGGPFDLGVGASGAIFGLFGVWLNGAYRKRRTAYGRYMLNQLSFLLLINAVLPFIVRNISWQAHLGGLVTGFLLAEAWSRMRRGRVVALRSASALLVLVVAMATVGLA
jgi:membrane associated rhomboid family serine protease